MDSLLLEQMRTLWQAQPNLPTLLIGSGLILLLAPSRLRQNIMDVAETIIASLLLLVLIVVVLGLPFGERTVVVVPRR